KSRCENNEEFRGCEVVWSWRRDPDVKLVERSASDGGKRGRAPGSTKETVKPLRGESRDVSAVPVVLPPCFSLHGGTGAVGARLSLRPLLEEGQRNRKTRAKSRRRGRIPSGSFDGRSGSEPLRCGSRQSPPDRRI